MMRREAGLRPTLEQSQNWTIHTQNWTLHQ
jgi:hypothetical protein